MCKPLGTGLGLMLQGVVICVAFRPPAATGGAPSQCTTPARLSLTKLARISQVVPDTAAARLGSIEVGDFIIGCTAHSAAHSATMMVYDASKCCVVDGDGYAAALQALQGVAPGSSIVSDVIILYYL